MVVVAAAVEGCLEQLRAKPAKAATTTSNTDPTTIVITNEQKIAATDMVGALLPSSSFPPRWCRRCRWWFLAPQRHCASPQQQRHQRTPPPPSGTRTAAMRRTSTPDTTPTDQDHREMEEEEEEEEGEEESLQERCVRLVEEFLEESGFHETLAALQRESGQRLRRKRRSRLAGALLSAVQAAIDLEALDKAAMEGGAASTSAAAAAADPVLAAPPNGVFARGPAAAVTLSATHRANVLCVRASPVAGMPRALLSTSTDKTVAFTADWNSPSTSKSTSSGDDGVVWRTTMPSAAIAVDWSNDGKRVVAGTMGGTVHVMDAATGDVKQTLSSHRKYVIAVRFLGNGSGCFVSASHDRRVVLYASTATMKTITTTTTTTQEETKKEEEYVIVRDWGFAGCVEAIAVLDGGKRVAVSVRDDNHLRAIDVGSTGEVSDLLNMNANGDDHVSFTALDLAASQDGRYLLAATDRDKLVLFDLARNGVQVRCFYGAPNDGMSMPRCCFGGIGDGGSGDGGVPQYVYGSGQDNAVHVWEVATQREVAQLRGHTKVVRALDFSIHANALVTASYDKTLRVWPASPHPSLPSVVNAPVAGNGDDDTTSSLS